MAPLGELLGACVPYSAYPQVVGIAVYFIPIMITPTGTLGSAQGHPGVGRMLIMVRNGGSSYRWQGEGRRA